MIDRSHPKSLRGNKSKQCVAMSGENGKLSFFQVANGSVTISLGCVWNDEPYMQRNANAATQTVGYI